MKGYKIDLNKSRIYNQVVKEDRTVQVGVGDILGELFPQPIAYLVSKIMGYEKRYVVLTPLKRYGKIIGVFEMSSTELAEYLIPSVRNLAQHVSTALELADEYAERKRMERELRSSEGRYRNLVDTAPDGIVTLNMKGVITSVNTATTRLSGYSENEFVGKHFSKMGFLRARDIPKYLELFSSIIRGKIPEPIELCYHNKDGNLRWVESRVGFLEAEGKKIGILAILRDVTERKRMDEELRRYSQHLEELVEERTQKLRDAERLAAIGETAAMVGHDLRNPLQVVVNTAYLAKKALKEAPLGTRFADIGDVEDLFRTVEQQVEYMDKIVSDLQDYARPLKPELAPTNLRQIINETLSTLPVPETIKSR